MVGAWWRGSRGWVVLGVVLTASCGGKPPSEFAQATSAPREVSENEPPVRVLQRKIEYRLDERGNWSESFFQRYEILTREGAEGWGGTGTQWSPWYMKRPVVTASVVDPDGTRRALDPKTLAESPVFPDLPEIYSDSRVLRAPLPGVRPGSVIEESIVRETKQPFFAGGSQFEVAVQSPVPLERVEVVIDLPKALPFQVEVLGADVKRTESEQGGRRRVAFSGGPYAALQPIDDYAPSDVPTWPTIAFSTAESWQQVAAAYAELVEAKLQGADVKNIARSAVRSEDSPAEKTRKLLAEVKRRVRYAAVEFGQAAIVPAVPSVTLERAYGDCKDQSLLLVALLRASGLDAKLALLRAGQGRDVRTRLPALDVFDHAIVHVAGAAPIWIDPTSDYARPNELPESDQGRLALIVDARTTDLTLTPVTTGTQNTYVETREIRLPEFGSSTVKETTVASGVIEHQIRSSFDGSKEELKKSLTEYVKRSYNAEALTRSSYGDARDLDRSFRIELEAKEASIGTSTLLSASAYTAYGVLFSFLPPPVFADEPRRVDLVLPKTYRAEVRYVLSPPPDFTAHQLPTPAPVDLGPGKFSRKYEKRADGSVEAIYAFAIDQRRLTPAELAALRKGIQALDAQPADLVEFEHEGQRLMEARKSVDAVRVLSRLAAKNPRDPLAQLRLAVTLVDLGFGDEARKHARAAVTADPNSAIAHRLLAIVLERDRFGRNQREGYDRAGVIAAHQRASELDPEDIHSRVQLALSYEHDEQGRRYMNAEQCGKAVSVYDAIPKEALATYDNGGFKHNALFALFYAERFDELRRRLAELPPNDAPRTLGIAMAALDGGVVAAVSEADRSGLRGEARSREFAAAGESLFQLRRYREAAALLQAASGESETSAAFANRAKLMQRVTPVDLAGLGSDTPEALVKKVLLLGLDTTEHAAALKQLLSTRVADDASSSDVSNSVRRLTMPVRKAVLVDALASAFTAKTEGNDANGFRVRAHFMLPGNATAPVEAYVVKEGKEYRLRAIQDNPELGCEALYLHRQRRDPAARAWLGWAREKIEAGSGDDALRAPPFVRLWKDGKGDVELAARALCVEGDLHADATAGLALARGRGDVDSEAVDHALALGYFRQKDYAKALQAAERLTTAQPKSAIAQNLALGALWGLKRWNDYEKVIRAALAQKPDKARRHALLEQLAGGLSQAGRMTQARGVLLDLIQEGDAPSGTYNNLAWNGLFTSGKRDHADAMLNHALEAAQRSNFKSYPPLHTLATVYLELGKIEEARQTLPKLLEFDATEPRKITWFIVGGLAEAYGMPDAAREAYERVLPGEEGGPTDTRVLARKRLQALKEKPAR